MTKRWLVAAGLAALFASPSARAGQTLAVDLTTANSSGTVNGGYFFQANPQPTGTGVLNTFLEIGQQGASNNPVERAYNTDGTREFQTGASGTHNHAVALSDVPFVTFNGDVALTNGGILTAGQYFEFIFDVNQTSNGANNTALSLSELQVFATSDPNLTGYDLTNHDFGANAALLYDMEGRVDGDTSQSPFTGTASSNYIALDYGVSSGGSGSGDMAFYLPVALFANYLDNQSSTYLVLSNAIGVPSQNNDGFEEWGFVRDRSGSPNPPVTTPEPTTVTMVLTALVPLGIAGLRRRRRQCDPVSA